MWAKANGNGYPCDRWTCPMSGKYNIRGQFYAADSRGMDSYVYVVTNGSVSFSSRIQSYPQTVSFTNDNCSLKQGDVVDFTISWGGGVYSEYSWTGVGGIISWADPHAAEATATVVNGYFVGATITDAGYGYTNTPGVRIIGGGGNGAQASAVVSNGLVVAVNILNPGNSYTNTPLIVIAPPFIEQPTMRITAMSQLSFSNLTVGTNYQLQSFDNGILSNVGAPFAATNSIFTQLVSGNASTSGYRLAATPVPSQALATAQVVGGFVVGFSVTSGGSGYLPPPAAPPNRNHQRCWQQRHRFGFCER